MQNSYHVPDNKSLSWKKNDKVPGRPVSSTIQNLQLKSDSKSPKKSLSKTKHRKTSSASSFQEFQDSTEDAWDIEDDDFCPSDIPIHPQVAKSTAMKVLSNHSKGTFSFSNSENSDDCTNTKPPTNDQDASTNSVTSGGRPFSSEKLNTQKVTEDLSSREPRVWRPQAPSNAPAKSAPGTVVRQTAARPSPFGLPPNTAFSSERSLARLGSFQALLRAQSTDMKELRKLSWSGIPNSIRPITWKLLSGFLPTSLERRESVLKRKKDEYHTLIGRYYDRRNEDVHHETYRQIHIDVPRMSPLVPLFQQETVQMAFERILYILAIRHPASGYVQGMNDLVTPFYVVFLQDYIPSDADVESYDVNTLPAEALQQVEADSYWCMQNLLDGIQDNYTFAQPGIQKKVHTLKELIQRVDAPLHAHLKNHSIEYLQFSFRWMNNLLMRELPLSCTIRLWDTYLSETNGFSNFHLYVCAAFLKHFSRALLQEKDFQGLMLTLQNLPTLHWTDNEISLLVAEAYKLKYMFDDAPSHLQPTES